MGRCRRRVSHKVQGSAALCGRKSRKRQVLVTIARSAPMQHSGLTGQGGMQQSRLTIAQEMSYVQAKAHAVICEESVAQANNVAVCHIFQ